MSAPSSASSLSAPSPGAAVLRFNAGMPGFPGAKTFSLRSWGTEESPFYVMECQDVIGLRFVVVGPEVFFASYEPQFGADVYQAVDASGPDDVFVLVILTLHSRPEQTTANLLGPLVVNARSGDAVQAALSGSGYEPQTLIVTKHNS
ncbi:MAG TPA: flagellar assembly protein FliW [Acidimicrobiales bacterium]|nr:flagellar assembly protein FliW [Acidimicrobiales bacterium]